MELVKKPTSPKYLLSFITFFRFNRDAMESYILAILPMISSFYGLPTRTAAMLIPIFFIGCFFAKFTFSYFTYRYSFRRALILQLLITFIGSLLSVVPNLITFFIGRFIQGLGIGCTTAATSVLTKYELKSHSFKKRWATIGMLIVWAPIVANAISGYLYYAGHWRLVFPLYLVLSIILLISANYLLPPEKIATEKTKSSIHLNMQFLKHPFFRYALAVYILLYATLPVFYTLSPFLFIQTLHVPVHYYWMVTFVMLSGSFVGKASISFGLYAYSSKKVSIYLLLQAILASILLLTLALLQAHSAILILIPCFFVAMSYSMAGPILKDEMFNCFSKEQAPATAVVVGVTVSLVSVIVSFIASLITAEDYIALAVFYLLFTVTAGICFLFLHRHLKT